MTATALRTVAKPARKAAKPIARRAVRTIGEATPRADIYQEVTDKIIAQLEAGVAPWAQPWGKSSATPALPYNASTGRRYSGVNVLMLWSAAVANGYPTMGWMTYQQAAALGGQVRKGERGTMIVFADRFTPASEKDKGDDARTISFLKRFTVFNCAQIDGLPADMTAADEPLTDCEQHEAAERLIKASGVPIRIGGDKAFYMPAVDAIAVPHQSAFFAPINYYRTVCHELSHATGHSSRLDRKLLNQFGSKDYAREELVAEMGSAFVCASLGIVPTVNHSDYIGSWLTVLREDNRAIFKAASAATKAADWLLAKLED